MYLCIEISFVCACQSTIPCNILSTLTKVTPKACQYQNYDVTGLTSEEWRNYLDVIREILDKKRENGKGRKEYMYRTGSRDNRGKIMGICSFLPGPPYY